MAREISWREASEDLTESEVRTYRELTESGVEVMLAPIVIESAEQLRGLGLSAEMCRTWRVGNQRFWVHLTPAPREVYDLLLGEMRAAHRRSYRAGRCQVPGTLKPTIRCPESNRCSACPYGRSPEERRASELSWDELVDGGVEPATSWDEAESEAVGNAECERLLGLLGDEDPSLALTASMRAEGYSARDIAEACGVAVPTVYARLRRARQICEGHV